MHRVVTDNCKKIRSEHQPAAVWFDSCRAWMLHRSQLSQKHKIRIKSRVRSDRWPLWHKWKDDDATDTLLLDHSVLMRCMRSSRSVMRVCTPVFSLSRNSMVSRARCAGAPSCWKMYQSPDDLYQKLGQLFELCPRCAWNISGCILQL